MYVCMYVDTYVNIRYIKYTHTHIYTGPYKTEYNYDFLEMLT